MEPNRIIEKYYKPETRSYHILIVHSSLVAEKSLEIAHRLEHLSPDTQFISEAAMLHDIGIFLTNEPSIGCYGENPYICHGCLGRELLEHEGLYRHALVCERHVGVGITSEEIARKQLPLPKRNMEPVTLEEKIICFADKFFSKGSFKKEKTLEQVRSQIQTYGEDKLQRFDEWASTFRS